MFSLFEADRFSGPTNSSIRSGSGMAEDAAHFSLNLLLGPVRMLVGEERRLVSPPGPIQPVRRLPTPLRRHPPENGELFGAGLFVGQHGWNLVNPITPGKSFASNGEPFQAEVGAAQRRIPRRGRADLPVCLCGRIRSVSAPWPGLRRVWRRLCRRRGRCRVGRRLCHRRSGRWSG
jgi:hypothetical protein